VLWAAAALRAQLENALPDFRKWQFGARAVARRPDASPRRAPTGLPDRLT
jgi:hypothetical protein